MRHDAPDRVGASLDPARSSGVNGGTSFARGPGDARSPLFNPPKKGETMKDNPKTIMIDDEKYVRAADVPDATYVPPTGLRDKDGRKYCIIRAIGAGVHAGFVSDHRGDKVRLRNSRRLWFWNSPDNTLSGISQLGPEDPSLCKFAMVVPELIIIGACEIITCSEAGARGIQQVPAWENGGRND